MIISNRYFSQEVPGHEGAWCRVADCQIPGYLLEMDGLIMEVKAFEVQVYFVMPPGTDPLEYTGTEQVDLEIDEGELRLGQLRACMDASVFIQSQQM